MARPALASADELEAFLASEPTWEVVDDGLVRTASAPSFAEGIRWVTQVADAAELMDHHPDIDIRWRTLRFRLSTHDAGGITALDFALAHEIEAIVSQQAGPSLPA